jgi:hypothetical protein
MDNAGSAARRRNPQKQHTIPANQRQETLSVQSAPKFKTVAERKKERAKAEKASKSAKLTKTLQIEKSAQIIANTPNSTITKPAKAVKKPQPA